jgi:hypothetical protein
MCGWLAGHYVGDYFDPSGSAASKGEEHRKGEQPPHIPWTMILAPLVPAAFWL